MVDEAQLDGEEQSQQVSPTQMVDADDLVWRIGQNTIEQIGYRKIVEKLNKKLQQSFEYAQNAEQRAQEAEQQAKEHKQASDALDVKNKDLAETLRIEREQYAALKEECDAFQSEIDRRDEISGKKKKG